MHLRALARWLEAEELVTAREQELDLRDGVRDAREVSEEDD